MTTLDELKKYRAEMQEVYSKVGIMLREANTAVEDEMRAQGLLFTLEVDWCCVGIELEDFETLEDSISTSKCYEDSEGGHVVRGWVVHNGKGETVASSE